METSPLSVYADDECCGKALSKALLSGALESADSWTHTKCGTEWKPRTENFNGVMVRNWQPQALIEVF